VLASECDLAIRWAFDHQEFLNNDQLFILLESLAFVSHRFGDIVCWDLNPNILDLIAPLIVEVVELLESSEYYLEEELLEESDQLIEQALTFVGNVASDYAKARRNGNYGLDGMFSQALKAIDSLLENLSSADHLAMIPLTVQVLPFALSQIGLFFKVETLPVLDFFLERLFQSSLWIDEILHGRSEDAVNQVFTDCIAAIVNVSTPATLNFTPGFPQRAVEFINLRLASPGVDELSMELALKAAKRFSPRYYKLFVFHNVL